MYVRTAPILFAAHDMGLTGRDRVVAAVEQIVAAIQ